MPVDDDPQRLGAIVTVNVRDHKLISPFGDVCYHKISFCGIRASLRLVIDSMRNRIDNRGIVWYNILRKLFVIFPYRLLSCTLLLDTPKRLTMAATEERGFRLQ